MKYFAILKDSLKEALDSKVLYVMFGLSTVMIILVGSLSFKPLAADKTLEQLFWVGEGRSTRPPVLTMILNGKSKEKSPPQETMMRLFTAFPYRLVKVDLLSGEEDSPEGEYALTISKIIPDKEMGVKAIGGPVNFGPDDPAKGMEIVREIFKEAETAGYIHVEKVEKLEIQDAAKETARYRATVKGSSKTRRIWVTEATWLFGLVPLPLITGPLGIQMYGLSYLVIAVGSWVTVIVGIVVTSFFFPNMLRKGTIDFLLVKPIQRWVLLVYKYIGGLTFMFLCTLYAIGGIWLVLGIRSGLWANGSLLLVFSLTFFFAILYAISTLVGVITRSTVTSIMLTVAAYAVLGTAGWVHLWLDGNVKAEEAREQDKGKMRLIMKGEDGEPVNDEGPDPRGTRWADSYFVLGSRTFQAIAPRTEDLNQMNSLILYTDFMSGNLTDMSKFDTGDRNWWVSLLVSVAWIGIFLGLAALWFTFKDY